MAASEELAARARTALDLVSRDTVARNLFTSAYTGTGDALLSLRAAADPAHSRAAREQVDDMRRIAFGRTFSPAEEAAAAAALQALYDDALVRARNADALDRAIQAALGGAIRMDPTGDPSPLPHTGHAAPRPAGINRRTWLVPIVALCLVVGYGSAGLARPWTGPAPYPSESDRGWVKRLPVVDPVTSARSGSPIAADEWFSEPQDAADKIDAPTLLSSLGIDPATTRFIQSTVHGSRLWIAKRPDRSYCIVGMRPGTGGVFGSCTTLDDFVREGSQLTQGLDLVRWDGIKFTITSTRSTFR